MLLVFSVNRKSPRFRPPDDGISITFEREKASGSNQTRWCGGKELGEMLRRHHVSQNLLSGVEQSPMFCNTTPVGPSLSVRAGGGEKAYILRPKTTQQG